MKRHYLQVTFRKGKPFAAYLYLSRRSGLRAAGTIDGGDGILVDLDEHGTPMGLEITAPSAVTVAQLNDVLAQQGIDALDAEEWAPLAT